MQLVVDRIGSGLMGCGCTWSVFVVMHKCGIEMSKVIGEYATYVW